MEIKIYSISGTQYEVLEKHQYNYNSNTIIINSLAELLELSKELKKDIIINYLEDTSQKPEIAIYDSFIE